MDDIQLEDNLLIVYNIIQNNLTDDIINMPKFINKSIHEISMYILELYIIKLTI